MSTPVTVGPTNVVDYAKRERLRNLLADAGSCRNCSGMEEATGAQADSRIGIEAVRVPVATGVGIIDV